MTWTFACPDWEDRLRNGRSLIPDLPLDQKEARRAIAIYNKLLIPDVAGTPSSGEVGAEWFRDIIAAIFGSYDLETGVRHVRESFNLVPKKNSKTTNGAALMVTALLMNRPAPGRIPADRADARGLRTGVQSGRGHDRVRPGWLPAEADAYPGASQSHHGSQD